MKALIVISLLFSTAAIAVSGWVYTSQPRIGYVHNARIFTEYNGMKEGQKMFQDQTKVWQANLDTLQGDFNAMVREYQATSAKMSTREKQLTEQLLGQKERDVVRYKNEIEKLAAESETKLSVEIINQINSFLLEYGKKNGYDYILGVTDDGSIHYAVEGDNLTDVVIKEMNHSYEGNL